MIKEALAFVTGLKDERPITVKVGNHDYAVKQDRTLGEVVREPAPIEKPTLKLVTLAGFVDALKGGLDGLQNDKTVVHVIDHLTVALVALEADPHGRRHEWLRATCGEKNAFQFNSYMLPEKFLIDLQSGFLPTDNVIALQRIASNLSNKVTITAQDDGFGQTLTVQGGASVNGEINIPTRIALYAYRTFREIDPTEGEFMFRLQGKTGEMPTCTLMEVDAGKWKLTAMESIAAWLKARVPEGTVVIA